MPERDWQKDWEMCQRATSGKWEEGGTWYGVRMVAWKEDAEFIAAAREALPFWLQRVRELEEAISRFIDARELAKRTGAPVSMTPVMWEAFGELRRVYMNKEAGTDAD